MKIEKTVNPSVFDIFRIGPCLAQLLSRIEGVPFSFKIANYEAILWDWNEQYPEYVDSITGDAYILTTSLQMHPTFEEKICTECRYDSTREDKAVCLGLHKKQNNYHQNIVDGKITFYDYSSGSKQPLIALPHAELLYGFIDFLIDYKEKNNQADLFGNTMESLLNLYADERQLPLPDKLERQKPKKIFARKN